MKIHSLLFQIIAPTVVGIIIGGTSYALLRDEPQVNDSRILPAHFASEILPVEETPVPQPTPSETPEPAPEVDPPPHVDEPIEERVDTLEVKEDKRTDAEKDEAARIAAEAAAAEERNIAYEKQAQEIRDQFARAAEREAENFRKHKEERAAQKAEKERIEQAQIDYINSDYCKNVSDDC